MVLPLGYYINSLRINIPNKKNCTNIVPIKRILQFSNKSYQYYVLCCYNEYVRDREDIYIIICMRNFIKEGRGHTHIHKIERSTSNERVFASIAISLASFIVGRDRQVLCSD